MSEVDLREEVRKLREEVNELKRQNKILAEAFLNHVKGKMTIEDLEICYQVLMKVKKFTYGLGGYGGAGGLEAVIAQTLLQGRQQKHANDEKIFEDIDEKEIEEIYNKLKNETKNDKRDGKEG